MRAWRKAAGGVAASLAISLLLLAAMEAVIVVMLNHPPPWLLARRVLSGYYTDVDRAIVQLLPECARYDAELGYTLRPGSCRFSNRDFATTLMVNSAGLRDDEDSLLAPEVIIVGDSFAMGWGVEDDETIGSILERQCRVKVLNAAVSSYGTAREMRMLHRLDVSAVRWLIVQYSDNDQGETQHFAEAGKATTPMPQVEYEALQTEMTRRQTYYPGKHLLQFFPFLGERLRSRAGSTSQGPQDVAAGGVVGESEAGAFLRTLASAPPMPHASAVVLEVNGSSRNDGLFVTELGRLLREGAPDPGMSIRTLDVSPMLTLDRFLPLDEHLSASGQHVLAQAIANELHCK